MTKVKIQIKVQITPEAKAALERICAERDMTQVGVISRLLTWFVEENHSIQSTILSLNPPGGMSLESLQETIKHLGESLEGLRVEVKKVLPPAEKPRKTA